jgi:hypothetical protein
LITSILKFPTVPQHKEQFTKKSTRFSTILRVLVSY